MASEQYLHQAPDHLTQAASHLSRSWSRWATNEGVGMSVVTLHLCTTLRTGLAPELAGDRQPVIENERGDHRHAEGGEQRAQ